MNQSDEQAGRWKDDIPVQPLNIIDTRTFAERVEEALTIEAFRAWLESKDGDDVVGRATYTRECPIHNFLHPRFAKKADETPLEVFGTVVVLHHGRGRDDDARLPSWVNHFITLLDFTGSLEAGTTAEQALAILAEVEKELADTSEKGEG